MTAPRPLRPAFAAVAAALSAAVPAAGQSHFTPAPRGPSLFRGIGLSQVSQAPRAYTSVAAYYGPNIGSSPFLFSTGRTLGPFYGPILPVGVTGQYGDPYGPWGAVPVGVRSSAFGPSPAIPALVNAEPVAGADLIAAAAGWRAGPAGGGPPPVAAAAPVDADGERDAGDAAFARGDLLAAVTHYDRAVAADPDRGDVPYRAALARLALGRWSAAGTDLRRALALDPALPATGPTLGELFGPGADAAVTGAVAAVADHARADPRDPDRLFLLAAAMRAAGDGRAAGVAAAAARLTGGAAHLRPYLVADGG